MLIRTANSGFSLNLLWKSVGLSSKRHKAPVRVFLIFLRRNTASSHSRRDLHPCWNSQTAIQPCADPSRRSLPQRKEQAQRQTTQCAPTSENGEDNINRRRKRRTQLPLSGFSPHSVPDQHAGNQLISRLHTALRHICRGGLIVFIVERRHITPAPSPLPAPSGRYRYQHRCTNAGNRSFRRHRRGNMNHNQVAWLRWSACQRL